MSHEGYAQDKWDLELLYWLIKGGKLAGGVSHVCNQTPGVVGVCRAWKYAWTFSVSGQNTHNK